jgi:general secretion pathway protein C
MTFISTTPPRTRAGRYAANLATAAFVIGAAWFAAKAAWSVLAPAPAAAGNAPVAVDLAAAAAVFGGKAGSAGGPVAASAGGLRLKGVVAPTPGETAGAIFNTGAARDVAVPLGGEVQPGVKLVEVDRDHVIVTRAGVRERIDLDTRKAPAGAAGAGQQAAGFKLSVARAGANAFTFARKDLDNALKDPQQMGYLGRIGQGTNGVRVEDAPPGSLARKLGLEPGDILKRINGQAVNSPGDLARLYQQFSTLAQIQAEVQRGTAVVQLTYNIQ